MGDGRRPDESNSTPEIQKKAPTHSITHRIQAGNLGKVPGIPLQLRVNLPVGQTPAERFMEVAAYPLSPLRQVFARFRMELLPRVRLRWLLH